MDSLAKCFSRDTNCVTREIAGETLIVPIKNRVGDLDSIYTLNEVATIIWQLVNGQTSVDKIIDAVHDAYDVDREEATKDTVEFLDSLEKEGLIKDHPPCSGT